MNGRLFLQYLIYILGNSTINISIGRKLENVYLKYEDLQILQLYKHNADHCTLSIHSIAGTLIIVNSQFPSIIVSTLPLYPGYKINQHKLVKEIPLVTKTWSLEFSILYSTVLTQVKPEVNIIDFKPRQPSSRSYSFSIQLQGNNTLSFQYEFRGTKTEYKIKLANTIDIKIHQKFKEEDTYNVTYYIDNVRIKEFDITNPSTQKDMIISSTECTIIETHPEEKTSFLAITEEPKFKVFPDGKFKILLNIFIQLNKAWSFWHYYMVIYEKSFLKQ